MGFEGVEDGALRDGAFDDLVGGSSDRDRSAAALERLRLDTAAEYDPGVVEALSKVAGRWYPGRL